MRIVNVEDVTAKDTPFPGIERKTLAHGDRMSAIQTILPKGTTAALHSHPHEQLSFCLQGRIEVSMHGETGICEAGGSWVVPGDVEHAAHALEDSLILEVFSPVREEFLD
ncbi:MAG: cupin [Chloroflexi bacterium]|jgi:quercetin dioxygenase-like cupin family protein|nr:cupin [Chloroflexota bacterium]|tara:strand:- start:2515 stop:2844 length:330 start_codon:yes stop_codon:yes gene_type:complete